MTYIRHVVHNGALHWVLFDDDGYPVAYCPDRDALCGWAAHRRITVVTIH